MIQPPQILSIAQRLAEHSAARQSLLAANVANADTPGYRARDLRPFPEILRDAGVALRATRPGHFGATADPAASEEVELAAAFSPDGNSVSLEDEMVRSADVQSQNDLAIAVFRSSLSLMSTVLGRR